MLTKILTSMLIITIMAVLITLAGEAYAERAMWVWGTAKDVVLNTNNAQTDFFNFCAAPHGDTTKAITMVFFDAKPYGFNLMTYNGGANLRSFLTDAHTRGMKVEFLTGDALWATPDFRAVGEALIDEVTTFNSGGTANQRFDGIQYDVEPYLLDSQRGADPLDWDYDKTLIWDTYLTLLTNCQTKINTYNAANNPDIRFGVAIPYWYVYGSTPGPQEVQSRVNYIAIMDYRDTASGIINGAQEEVANAPSGKKVYVGVETGSPTDLTDFPPSTTFHEEGNSAMETALTQVNNAFSGYAGYSGIALHYYEDLTGPRGYEAAYRRLWEAGSFPGHAPVVAVVSPNRVGETLVGTVYIQWDASDLDGNALTIDIQYSANGGTSWTNIATGLTNTGSYTWNTTGLTAGSNYLIKIIATDNSANNLVGYDISNNVFSISGSVVQTDITDLYLWNESASSLRLKWTPPNHTPRYYRIYLSVNGAAFPGSPTYDNVIATTKYVDTGLSSANKHKYKIKAVYGNGSQGNDSNISNMLIPGNQFLADYCEGDEGITYATYGASALTNSLSAVDKKEGAKSLRLNYTYTGSGWGAVLVGTLPVKVDISPYKSVKYWAKGGTVNGSAIAFQLKETGRTEGDETWQSPAVFITNTDWTEYQFNFANFTRVDGSGNNRIDTHSIGGYGLFFNAGNTPNGTYYVDEIRFLKGEASLGVPQSDYTFGTVSGSISDHRFGIGPIPVSFGGFDPPWTVRIWTNNGTGADQAGLKGADGVTYIPLKVWCGNFGPGANVPDEENDTYWVNNETGWFRIPEDDEMNPSDAFTWRRLAWNSGGQDASLGSPFNIYLAIDVAGKKNQQYQTTTLTLEYINE